MLYRPSFIHFIEPIVSFISRSHAYAFDFFYDFFLETINYLLTATFIFFIFFQSRHTVFLIANTTIYYYLLIGVSSLLPLFINASSHMDGSKYWGFFEIIVCLKRLLLSVFNLSFLDLIALFSVFFYIFQTPFLVTLSSLFVVPQGLVVSCIEGLLLFSRVRALALSLFDYENHPRGLILIHFLSICLILEFNTPIIYEFLSDTHVMKSVDLDAYRLLQFSLSSPAISKSLHSLHSKYHTPISVTLPYDYSEMNPCSSGEHSPH